LSYRQIYGLFKKSKALENFANGNGIFFPSIKSINEERAGRIDLMPGIHI
jgi:hypothetical protein